MYKKYKKLFFFILGNISKQLEIKERLQCKPFKWFMEKIAAGALKEFPIPPVNQVWGEVSFFFYFNR
jgi:hypothetical protein